MPTNPPRILCNDDGWIIGAPYGPPLTPEHLRDEMIATYADSPVDVFLWSVGGHEVYDYETEVGERYGDGYDNLQPDQQRHRDNLRHLIQEHGGPLTIITQLCHEAGLSFFPSIRMNEHYEIDEAAPNYGRLRRDHPEWLIGRPDEEPAPGSLQWGIRTGINYAVPEVRAFMTRVIFELIEGWDIDGIELDLMRHPAFFRWEEAFAHAYLMTDLVRQVRNKLDVVGKQRGKKLDLAVRVPPTLADSRRIGLDAAEWMREGLIDLLIAGGGFIPFGMPIREFVEAAEGTGCRVYGCSEGNRHALDEEKVRAIAARYWRAGVDGLYFFNCYNLSHRWKRDVLSRLADPAALTRLDKLYELDCSIRAEPLAQLSLAFRNAIPWAPLPVAIQATLAGRGVVLSLEIADDPQPPCTGVLGLNFARLATDEELSLELNGSPLVWNEGARSSNQWTRLVYAPSSGTHPAETQAERVSGDHIEFHIDRSLLRSGVNELELRRVSGSSEPPVLTDVRLWIRYGA